MLRHRYTLALIIALIVPTLLPSLVAAWGCASHQAIGLAAESQLTPQAKAALARILQDTDTLSPGIEIELKVPSAFCDGDWDALVTAPLLELGRRTPSLPVTPSLTEGGQP